jgi:hypothetical protein
MSIINESCNEIGFRKNFEKFLKIVHFEHFSNFDDFYGLFSGFDFRIPNYIVPDFFFLIGRGQYSKSSKIYRFPRFLIKHINPETSKPQNPDILETWNITFKKD